MLIHREELRVFADYHQFYLWDGVISPDAPETYTDEDVARRIKTGQYVVVIQPERDLEVPVTIEVHDQEPVCDLTAWNHVAEASLLLPNGALQIHECTGGPVTNIAVVPGTFVFAPVTRAWEASAKTARKATIITSSTFGQRPSKMSGCSSSGPAPDSAVAPDAGRCLLSSESLALSPRGRRR